MLPAAVLLADYAGTLDVSNRAELRTRVYDFQNSSGPSAPPVGGIDFFDGAFGHARLTNRTWTFALDLSPALTIMDLEGNTTFLGMDATHAEIRWHSRWVSIQASGDLFVGAYNSANLYQPPPVTTTPTPPPTATGTAAPGAPATTGTGGTATLPATMPVQTVVPALATVPVPQTITTESSHSTLGMYARIGRRASFYADVALFTSGGLDEASRRILPAQYGPQGNATFSYVVSRRDAVSTTAGGQAWYFSDAPCVAAMGSSIFIQTNEVCSPRIQTAQLAEGVRHSIDRATTLGVTGGATYAHYQFDVSQPYQSALYPSGQAFLTRAFGHRGTNAFTATARLAPYVDVLTGFVSNMVQGTADLAFHEGRLTAVRAEMDAGRTLGAAGPLAVTLVQGQVHVDRRIDRQLQLTVGVLGLWQNQDAFGTLFSAFAFVGVSARASPLHF